MRVNDSCSAASSTCACAACTLPPSWATSASWLSSCCRAIESCSNSARKRARSRWAFASCAWFCRSAPVACANCTRKGRASISASNWPCFTSCPSVNSTRASRPSTRLRTVTTCSGVTVPIERTLCASACCSTGTTRTGTGPVQGLGPLAVTGADFSHIAQAAQAASPSTTATASHRQARRVEIPPSTRGCSVPSTMSVPFPFRVLSAGRHARPALGYPTLDNVGSHCSRRPDTALKPHPHRVGSSGQPASPPGW